MTLNRYLLLLAFYLTLCPISLTCNNRLRDQLQSQGHQWTYNAVYSINLGIPEGQDIC